MGDVIDLARYRQRTSHNGSTQHDGLYLEAVPPFIAGRHHENGVIRQEHRVISENMLRDLLESLP